MTEEEFRANIAVTEEEFHTNLVKELYDLAWKRCKDRWPIAASTLHRRAVFAALCSAYMKASAGEGYVRVQIHNSAV